MRTPSDEQLAEMETDLAGREGIYVPVRLDAARALVREARDARRKAALRSECVVCGTERPGDLTGHLKSHVVGAEIRGFRRAVVAAARYVWESSRARTLDQRVLAHLCDGIRSLSQPPEPSCDLCCAGPPFFVQGHSGQRRCAACLAKLAPDRQRDFIACDLPAGPDEAAEGARS